MNHNNLLKLVWRGVHYECGLVITFLLVGKMSHPSVRTMLTVTFITSDIPVARWTKDRPDSTVMSRLRIPTRHRCLEAVEDFFAAVAVNPPPSFENGYVR